MRNERPSSVQASDKWMRMVVNGYWITLAVTVLGQIAVYAVSERTNNAFDASEYMKHYVWLPDVILVVLLGGLEAALRKLPERKDAAIFIAGMLLAMTLAFFMSAKLPGALVILLLPMLAGMFMLKPSYIHIALGVNGVYLLLLFAFAPGRQSLPFFCEMAIVAFVLLAAAFSGVGVLKRGSDLFAVLEKSHKSVQELLVKNAMMDRMNKIDALTELYNHKTYHEYAEKLAEQQQRSEFPLQVAMMDVDNFKLVNDTYGHWVGDIVLRRVAEIIREHMEADDFAARYGGEEFIVLLTLKPVEQSIMVVEAIRRTVAEVRFEEMGGRSVTISIGLHDFAQGESKADFFRIADAALYEAKKTGKNKTVIR
ncbi:GGDEF domain-containing protein [Paenibacillus methanolicus]|uniref:Diguanylate cyclase (GGDEF)-like protein n=1 Tax=Paenibacillus methanolicus TaxID=582686 RepID=A0A5S5BP91_9BACL|nr:GGDEF domain-containing protein [Paenibacillus methanolicus]TYP68949.1 diguanylate cyclase (GGDEF)-like protein [Paenibacillus methanolicus]